jgi:hypothetical protein
MKFKRYENEPRPRSRDHVLVVLVHIIFIPVLITFSYFSLSVYIFHSISDNLFSLEKSLQQRQEKKMYQYNQVRGTRYH